MSIDLDEAIPTAIEGLRRAGLPDVDAARARLRRSRRVRMSSAGIVVVIILLLGASALLGRGDHDASEVITQPAPTDVVGGFAPLGPGWHELDTGPVPASGQTSTAWTGTELVVVAGDQTFAYDPTTSQWRSLPSLPFQMGEGGRIVWTGEVVVAIGSPPGVSDQAQAAILDPDADGPWSIIESPELPPQLGGSAGMNMSSLQGNLAPIWTGQRVIDPARWAVLDPAGWTWSPLALPDDLAAIGPLSLTNRVWDGTELVAAPTTTEPGLAWDATGSTVRSLPAIPAELLPRSGFVLESVGTSPSPGTVVLVTDYPDVEVGETNAWRLDVRAGQWTMLPPNPTIGSSEGCPSGIASVDGVALVAPCWEGHAEALIDGEWQSTGGPTDPAATSGARWITAGDAVVSWSSNDDAVNDPNAPRVEAWAWVPPTAPDAITTPPTTTVKLTSTALTSADQALADLGPGWHQLDTGPVPASQATSTTWTGSELIVAAGLETFAYAPESKAWRSLGTLPFEDGTQEYDQEHGSVVWTGRGTLAVSRGSSGRAPESAFLDAGGTQWRELDGPDIAPTMVPLGSNVPLATRWGGLALVWTGQRVLDVSHGAVFDPATQQWSELAMPDGVQRLGTVLLTPVFDGHDVVLAAAGPAPGVVWNATGSTVRDLAPIPGDLLAVPDTNEPSLALVPEPGVVVLIAGDDPADPTRTNSWRLDVAAGRWSALPRVPGMTSSEGCPVHAVVVGGVPVLANCAWEGPDRVVALGADGAWMPTRQPSETVTSGGAWLATPSALIAWSSDTDTLNNPRAPYTEAWIWVPPQ